MAVTFNPFTANFDFIGSSTATSVHLVNGEVPTDSGDHTNFTMAHTPSASTFKVFRGGARQQVTADYTQVGTAIVLVVPLATGETLLVDYSY